MENQLEIDENELPLVVELDEFMEELTDKEDRQLFVDLIEKNKDINLNSRLHGLHKSATLEINEISSKLEREGKKIYKFGLGQSPFPVPDIAVRRLQENAHQKDYLPVKGLYDLRVAVAAFHQKKNGIKLSYKQVSIGPGSKELLFLTQLCFNGDLIIPTPCWVSYIPQAVILGKRIRLLNTTFESKWRLTASMLRTLCREDKYNHYNHPRLLLLNYPGNPEGNTYTGEELQKIAKVARKYNILILSDEIYGDLNFSGKHISIARYYPEGTIISSGISKWAGAGGWRLGTYIFPKKLKWLQDAMAVVASETYTSVSAPIQFGAVALFEPHQEFRPYLRNSRRILKALGFWIVQKLHSVDVLVHEPKGAFYLFLDFSNYESKFLAKEITTSQQLTTKLLEDTGVAILPGVDFIRPSEEFAARLAYVNFDGGKALEAASEYGEIDEAFLMKYCTESLEGMQKLVDWLVAL